MWHVNPVMEPSNLSNNHIESSFWIQAFLCSFLVFHPIITTKILNDAPVIPHFTRSPLYFLPPHVQSGTNQNRNCILKVRVSFLFAEIREPSDELKSQTLPAVAAIRLNEQASQCTEWALSIQQCNQNKGANILWHFGLMSDRVSACSSFN